MSNLEKLKIVGHEERESVNPVTGEIETFPVVLIEGISFGVSSTGNASFTKRKASLPVNGVEVNEVKQLFPIGSFLDGYEIVRKRVAEAYDWEAPDGRILTLNHSWTVIRKGDPVPHEVPPADMSPPVRSEVGTDAEPESQPAPQAQARQPQAQPVQPPQPAPQAQ